MHNPSYLCKNRHGKYYFRFVIPEALRPHLSNKKEIRRSLGTLKRQEALQLVRPWVIQMDLLLMKVRGNLDSSKSSINKIS